MGEGDGKAREEQRVRRARMFRRGDNEQTCWFNYEFSYECLRTAKRVGLHRVIIRDY
jgi:hypothetical protein